MSEKDEGSGCLALMFALAVIALLWAMGRMVNRVQDLERRVDSLVVEKRR